MTFQSSNDETEAVVHILVCILDFNTIAIQLHRPNRCYMRLSPRPESDNRVKPVTCNAQPRARHPCLLSESNSTPLLQSCQESVVSAVPFLGLLQAWPPISADTRGSACWIRSRFTRAVVKTERVKAAPYNRKPGRVGHASSSLDRRGIQVFFAFLLSFADLRH